MHDTNEQQRTPAPLLLNYFWDQTSSNETMRVRFSWERRVQSFTESNSLPNIVKHVVGPSNLFGCKGKPKSNQSCRRVAKLVREASEAGGPNVRKSFK